MYTWFTQKAALMASMRKAIIALVLMVMLLQTATTPAVAMQQSGGEEPTPPAAMQQGSVSPPPANNNGSEGTPAGGDDATINENTPLDNNYGGTPPAKGVGNIVDPVNVGGDTSLAGGDSSTTNQSSRAPANNNGGQPPAGGVGNTADAIKDPGDTVDTSTQGSILVHCSPVTGCSNENLGAPNNNDKSISSNSKEGPDAPKDEQSSAPKAVQAGEVSGGITSTAKENDTSSQQAPTASDEAGQVANNGVVYGCPGDYYYDGSFDRCMPVDGTFGPAGAILGISGIDSVGDATGDVIASPVYVAGDWLKGFGLGIQLGLDYYGGESLIGWGQDIGGPVGWPLEGVGYTVSAVGDVAGYGVEGVGQVLDYAADGIANTVGDVVDLVGDAGGAVVDSVGNVVDDIGSWFGW